VDVAQMGPICVNAAAYGEDEHDGAPAVVFGAGVVGLLTTIPVLLMGLFAPIGPWVSGRIGPRNAIALCMLGIVAFGLLMWTQTSFDGVFFVSFCFALVGLAVLLLFVQNPRPEPRLAEVVEAPQGNRLRLLAERRFLGLGLAGALLGVATMSDGFVYLGLQQKLDFEPGMFPLLFVATASVFMLLAVPMGQLADRVGRTKVFLGGYCLLLPVYGLLLATDVGLAAVVLATVLLGTFYAATDGVLAAMASALLPEEVRGTGLAALVTATSTGRMLASILFGALWTAFGYEAAVAAFVVVLLSALATATPILVRMQRRASNA
jgi:MFS family permease